MSLLSPPSSGEHNDSPVVPKQAENELHADRIVTGTKSLIAIHGSC